MTPELTARERDEARRRAREEVRVAMSEASAIQPGPPSVAAFSIALRPQLKSLTRILTDAIRDKVPAYDDERFAAMVSNAVAGALTAFTESLAGPAPTGPKVDDHFRRLGYRESLRDGQLVNLHSALYIGIRDGWTELRSAALAFGLDADGLSHIGDAMFAFADHLGAQTIEGRRAARARTIPATDPLQELLDTLVAGSDQATLDDLADRAGFALPDHLVVLVTAGRTAGDAVAPPEDMLARPDGTLVVCAPQRVDAALDHLRQAAPLKRVAVTWPVLPGEVDHAVAWGNRVLDLARNGVIAPEPVLSCDEYRTEIWLHSEPALRQRMVQDLLHPLLAETPNSREILSETLLAWLETRDSAPAIAAALGVHPQTVRYRWKRINELFGEDLHDPEFIVQITMVLKASLPLWRGGDQSDFELYAEGSRDV